MATVNYDKCISVLNSLKPKYPKIVNEFQDWYEDGGWEDDGLNDEFLDAAEESSFVDWIKENETISTDSEGVSIWQLLHDAIKSASIGEEEKEIINLKAQKEQSIASKNQSKNIIVELLSVDIAPKERKQCVESSKSPIKKRISDQSSSMLPSASTGFLHKKKNQAQDILHVELLGYKNKNYPLLLHFVDSYVRLQLNEWIISGKKQHNKYKFSVSEFFSSYCCNAAFVDYMKSATSSHTLDFIGTAIDSYQKRVLPSFQLMEPIYKLNGAILDFSKYLFAMARIVRNASNQPIHDLTMIIPIQIDFLLLNTKIKDVRPDAHKCAGVDKLFADDEEESDDYDDIDSDDADGDNDDDDDDDDHKDEYISSDLDQVFKSNGIEYYAYDNPLRSMLRVTKDVKSAVANKRSQRVVFVIDRRINKKKKKEKGKVGDMMYLFKPNKYNKFEANDQELIHSSLHHNSVSSIIPRLKVKKSKRKTRANDDFGVRDSLKGQMFAISFHILSRDEIRCYLFYQGQCWRFYGEDLINVLPLFFVDTKAATDTLLKMYNDKEWRKSFDEFCDVFVDKKFDRFYYDLTAKMPRISVVK